MNKKIIAAIVLLLLAGASWWSYQRMNQQQTRRDVISILPGDAIYFLKTENLTEAWKEVSGTNIWQHLITTKGFEFLQETDTLLNDALLNNKTGKYIFKNRPTLMAAYMTASNDYDFVYVVDLQKTAYIKQILDGILKLSKSYKVSKIKYQQYRVIKLTDKKDASNVTYITAVDNLLVASFTYKLIRKLIDEKDRDYWHKNKAFVQVNDKLDNGLIQFFLNYRQLPAFAGIYFQDARKDTEAFARQLALSGFDISHDEERITMDGFTVTDSLPSYMNALLDVKPGKIKSYEIISNQAALTLSLGFKNFNLFYQSLLDQYATESKAKRDAYRTNIKKLEKYFKIDLQKDLFDWIGQEITLVKLRSFNPQKPESAVMLIAAEDMDEARRGLTHISEQIKKRSPFKFKSYTYKNFEIYYLHQKGFFKTILGNLFEKIDKPYYTLIEDYVVFSNSEAVLKSFIDDYLTGKTLSHNEDFVDFNDEMSAKANIHVFIQMPKLYDILQKSLLPEGKKALEEKKDLTLSFSRIGFQMIAKDDLFKTLILIDHDEEALKKDKAEKLAVQSDKSIHNEYFEDLQFKVFFPDSVVVANGKYIRYYPDGKTLKLEGKVKDNLPEGIWRSYYESGNLQSVVPYNKGEVDGNLFYYFDKKPEVKMAEMRFENDLLEGLYTEYWKNGALKAKLHYKDGRLNGDAFYYYPTGQLKIKGKYKKGEKKGKWLFYDEKGNVIDKKKYSGLF